MSYSEYERRVLRLDLLRLLAKQPAREAGSRVLELAVRALGYRYDRPMVDAQLIHLETVGAVALERLDGDRLIARLLRQGQRHVDRQVVLPDVAEPDYD